MPDKQQIQYKVAGETVDADGKIIGGEGSVVNSATLADAQAKPRGGTFDVASASREEMEAEVQRRGLTVERGDGKSGAPVMDDYRAALGG